MFSLDDRPVTALVKPDSLDGMRGASPTVSVIIPCFDGERYLEEAVTSVLGQTHADVEVVVVDDGSSDRSLQVLEGLGDRRLRVIRQPHAGVAAARNRGVRESTGPYVAFLDQDDTWLPEKLELQLACLRRSPELGLVYSDFYVTDADARHQARWSDRYPLYRGRVFDRLIATSVIPISTVVLPRAVFEAAGGFPPQYRYVEDLALLLGVAARHPIDVVRVPLARYRRHPASVTQVLGLEVAVGELKSLCAEWVAADGSRAPVIRRALGQYLYLAGKTAFYDGNDRLAARYLADAWRQRRLLRARLFAAGARHWPEGLRGLRAAILRLRGHTSDRAARNA